MLYLIIILIYLVVVFGFLSLHHKFRAYDKKLMTAIERSKQAARLYQHRRKVKSEEITFLDPGKGFVKK